MAELQGYREARDRLVQLREGAKQVIPIIQDEAENAHLDMKAIVQVATKQTSDLIIYKEQPDGAIVHSQSNVSQILEFGSIAHDIYPRYAKMLHWVSKSGEHIYAKHVKHPGTRPYPFFYPVVWASSIKIHKRIVEAMK